MEQSCKWCLTLTQGMLKTLQDLCLGFIIAAVTIFVFVFWDKVSESQGWLWSFIDNPASAFCVLGSKVILSLILFLFINEYMNIQLTNLRIQCHAEFSDTYWTSTDVLWSNYIIIIYLHLVIFGLFVVEAGVFLWSSVSLELATQPRKAGLELKILPLQHLERLYSAGITGCTRTPGS